MISMTCHACQRRTFTTDFDAVFKLTLVDSVSPRAEPYTITACCTLKRNESLSSCNKYYDETIIVHPWIVAIRLLGCRDSSANETSNELVTDVEISREICNIATLSIQRYRIFCSIGAHMSVFTFFTRTEKYSLSHPHSEASAVLWGLGTYVPARNTSSLKASVACRARRNSPVFHLRRSVRSNNNRQIYFQRSSSGFLF